MRVICEQRARPWNRIRRTCGAPTVAARTAIQADSRDLAWPGASLAPLPVTAPRPRFVVRRNGRWRLFIWDFSGACGGKKPAL